MKRILKSYQCGNIYKYTSVRVTEKRVENDIFGLTRFINRLNEKDKLENNLIRARNHIKDLILCNNFKYFITITFNFNYDRTDFNYLRKLINDRIRKARQKYNLKLDFIFVPELHKDGENYHFHGVLSGDFNSFIYYNEFDHKTCKLFDSFGFVSVEDIQDNIKIANYISKYITKSFDINEKNKHCYFTSNGLNKPNLIESIIYENVYFDKSFFYTDYSNEYYVKYDKNKFTFGNFLY